MLKSVDSTWNLQTIIVTQLWCEDFPQDDEFLPFLGKRFSHCCEINDEIHILVHDGCQLEPGGWFKCSTWLNRSSLFSVSCGSQENKRLVCLPWPQTWQKGLVKKRWRLPFCRFHPVRCVQRRNWKPYEETCDSNMKNPRMTRFDFYTSSQIRAPSRRCKKKKELMVGNGPNSTW